VDYTPEDIIEKVCVQFYPHFFTGRPRSPHWYPGWPIYMCEQRYDDRNHSFFRISKPELCFPPSLRQHAPDTPQTQLLGNTLMRAHINRNSKLDAIQPIYPFERLVFPLRKSGPNAGPRLPTNTSAPTSFTIGPSDIKDSGGGVGALYDGGRDGRGRPRRMAAVKAATAVGAAPPGSPGGHSNPMPLGGMTPAAQSGDRTIVSAAGGGIITSAMVDRLPSETSKSLNYSSCLHFLGLCL
jgi:chromatin structure-remodeling complex subunit RSC1/2